MATLRIFTRYRHVLGEVSNNFIDNWLMNCVIITTELLKQNYK